MIVPKYVLKLYQSSRKSSYVFAFYNDFCKVCEKNNLSPPSPLNEERKKERERERKKIEEIKPNFEGSYFTIVLDNLAQIWYVPREK